MSETLRQALLRAITGCPHFIDANAVTLERSAEQGDGNALSQLVDRIEAALAAQAQAEPVRCTRCGHENWIMQGKAPAQITEADKAPSAQPVAEPTTTHPTLYDETDVLPRDGGPR